MPTFQRARSAEAREIRRQAILDTAALMLARMPAGEITLNELSRQSELAKSAILKYFESREAVLLELLDQAWKQWTADLAGQWSEDEDPAATLTRTLAAHPQFCDLLSAQAGVLEHNVSAAVASRYKKAAFANVADLVELIDARLPGLGAATGPLCAQIIMVTGAVWTHSRPSAAMLAAYAADPGLAALRMPFAPTLENMIATLIAGTRARAG